MKKDDTNATSKKGYSGKPLFEKEEGYGEIGAGWENYDPNDTVQNNHDARIRRNKYEENIR